MSATNALRRGPYNLVKPRQITERQTQVLRFIVDYIAQCGMPPTLREISTRFGFASTAAARDHVLALVKKGALERDAAISRGIRIVGANADLPVPKDAATSFDVRSSAGFVVAHFYPMPANAREVARRSPSLAARKTGGNL